MPKGVGFVVVAKVATKNSDRSVLNIYVGESCFAINVNSTKNYYEAVSSL